MNANKSLFETRETLVPASYELVDSEREHTPSTRPTLIPTAQEQMDLELESIFAE
jgi:hypothetical protein